MKDRIRKMKEWTSEHQEAVVVTGMLAFYGICVIAAIKIGTAMQEEAEREHQKMIDAINQGKVVLPNADGSFWIIDRPVA